MSMAELKITDVKVGDGKETQKGALVLANYGEKVYGHAQKVDFGACVKDESYLKQIESAACEVSGSVCDLLTPTFSI